VTGFTAGGARRLRRFTVKTASGMVRFRVSELYQSKRAEARAPLPLYEPQYFFRCKISTGDYPLQSLSWRAMRVLNKETIIGLALVLLTFSVQADDVDDLLKLGMQKHHVPGMACLVFQNGQPVKTFYGGIANLEWNAPVGPETVFEIGSVSKQFAAASILLLAEAGKLSIDDPISKYLTNTPPAWADVKIRNLLSHTSGIHSYDNLDGFELRQHLTQAQFIRKLAQSPPDFKPGESWAYCNAGYNLLGYIVENVSGKSYWDFLQEHIFTPLQMTHTTIRNPDKVIANRAAGYVYTKAGYRNRDYDLTDLFAAGSIVSTVSDLAKWDDALQNDRLLKESSKQLWWTPAVLNNGKPVVVGKPGEGRSYGFGWFLGRPGGHKNIGHSGITSGFSAANEFYPDDHLTIIILSNTDDGYFAGDLSAQLAKLYFSKSAAK
jgi:CubicO group peptidase (beta-lactamase class C family)